MKRHIGIVFSVVFFALFCYSCQKTTSSDGKLSIHFALSVDGGEVVFDTLQYVNAAQNQYEVNEVKFFISDLKLYKHGGGVVSIQDNRSTHYYDAALSSTHIWNITDAIDIGAYDSIAFVFGLPPEKNVTGFFVNPPENNMAWPVYLGGGYHYLQINGYWLRGDSVRTPFNLHTGIGQLYENEQIIQYIPNHFTLVLSNKSFEIKEGTTTSLTLTMDINQWFTSPHNYNLDEWGESIMQNQEAQEILKENGQTVFH